VAEAPADPAVEAAADALVAAVVAAVDTTPDEMTDVDREQAADVARAVLAAAVPALLAERDRLAAQLAAARSEGDLLGEAWTVIANSGVFGNPDTPTEGCREAAIRWRDKYHAYLADLWESVAEVPASPSTPEEPS
jgi:hypothetical protein